MDKARATPWVNVVADYCSRCGEPRKLPVYSTADLVLSCACTKTAVKEEKVESLFSTMMKLSIDVGDVQAAMIDEDYAEALVLLFKIAARAKALSKHTLFDAVWEEIDEDDDSDLGDE